MTEPDRETAEEPAPEQTESEEEVELHGGGWGKGATKPVQPPATE